MARSLQFPFIEPSKNLTRAATRTNRNQLENREELINGVVGGLAVVALFRSNVSLIPQVGSIMSRNCSASNQSLKFLWMTYFQKTDNVQKPL